MVEAGLTPYAGEARGARFLRGTCLLQSDVRNVMVHTKGSYEFDAVKQALSDLWPVKAPAHSSSKHGKNSSRGDHRGHRQRRQDREHPVNETSNAGDQEDDYAEDEWASAENQGWQDAEWPEDDAGWHGDEWHANETAWYANETSWQDQWAEDQEWRDGPLEEVEDPEAHDEE